MGMTAELALRLRDAGLQWREPAPGDRFVVFQPELLDTPFVISDMTVNVHDFPSGTVIGFNGVTEWALDSVALEQTLWLPREDQLRELLGSAFLRLERLDGGYRVVVRKDDQDYAVLDPDPVQAYGEALLVVLTGSVLRPR